VAVDSVMIRKTVTYLMVLYIFCRPRALPASFPTPSDLCLKPTDLQFKVTFGPAPLTSSDIDSILFFTILLLWMEAFSSFRFWPYRSFIAWISKCAEYSVAPLQERLHLSDRNEIDPAGGMMNTNG
jgi:hypothetical protein